MRALSVTVTVATMMSILPDGRYGMRLPDACPSEDLSKYTEWSSVAGLLTTSVPLLVA